MKKYVVGFLFNQDLTQVVLIRKNRPAWQAQKLNGVGGKVEPGEDYLGAMVREFHEETGTYFDAWRRFCDLVTPDGEIICFFGVSKNYLDVKTVTDEEIEIHAVDALMFTHFMIPNLRALLQLARVFSYGETANRFILTEVHANAL